jgi:hypothetical protein
VSVVWVWQDLIVTSQKNVTEIVNVGANTHITNHKKLMQNYIFNLLVDLPKCSSSGETRLSNHKIRKEYAYTGGLESVGLLLSK